MPLPFEEIILWQIQAAANPLLDLLMVAITFLGNPAFWIIAAAVIYWRGRENESFYLMNLMVFVSAFVALAKSFFHLPRPAPEQFRVIDREPGFLYGNTAVLDYSFPSGHSAVVASALAHFWHKIRGSWKIIVLLLVFLVAFSRLYLGQHFLSDVIAGLLIGYLIGRGNRWLIRDLKEHHFKPTKIAEEMGVVAAVIIALILIIFFEPPALAVTALGFYAGFFLIKEKGWKFEDSNGTNFYIKTIAGMLGIALILSPIYIFKISSGGIMLAVFFICGSWISIIYPLLYEGALGKFLKVRRA